MQAILDFYQSNALIIWGGLFAVSELLALIPGLKSNSVFQLMFNGLKKMAGK